MRKLTALAALVLALASATGANAAMHWQPGHHQPVGGHCLSDGH